MPACSRPLVTAAPFVDLHFALEVLPTCSDRFCWVPFAGAIGLFLLGFHGLAYSFFPFVAPNELTIWQAAASDQALWIMFVGAMAVLPVIGLYTVFAYRVFRGKATELRYA